MNSSDSCARELPQVYFDDGYHPTPLGHKLIASVLVYHVMGPLWGGVRGHSDSGASEEARATVAANANGLLSRPMVLPEPIVVTRAQAGKYVSGAFARIELRESTSAAPHIAASDGFKVRGRSSDDTANTT
jgi:hypothetical protein